MGDAYTAQELGLAARRGDTAPVSQVWGRGSGGGRQETGEFHPPNRQDLPPSDRE